MRRGQLAVAKRYGISELTIYKGCKRSSGFQNDQHQAPDAAHQRGDQLVLSLFLGCMEPPLGASGCDSGLCSIILSSAALPQGNEPRDLKLRAYASRWLGRKGTRRTVLVGAWDSFTFTTLPNTAPAATINDHSLHTNEWRRSQVGYPIPTPRVTRRPSSSGIAGRVQQRLFLDAKQRP